MTKTLNISIKIPFIRPKFQFELLAYSQNGQQSGKYFIRDL